MLPTITRRTPKAERITKELFEYRTALQLLGDPSCLTFTCPSKPHLHFRVRHLGEGMFEIEGVRGHLTITQVIRLIWEGKFETPKGE